jgi:hypothetical protein
MKKYSFTAKIQEVGSGGAFVLFPYDVEKEFGTRGRVPVQATLDGVAYRGSLRRRGRTSAIRCGWCFGRMRRSGRLKFRKIWQR